MANTNYAKSKLSINTTHTNVNRTNSDSNANSVSNANSDNSSSNPNNNIFHLSNLNNETNNNNNKFYNAVSNQVNNENKNSKNAFFNSYYFMNENLNSHTNNSLKSNRILNKFLNDYYFNLLSFKPIIHQEFLDRVIFKDKDKGKNLKKMVEELVDMQQNIEFRQQIYIDFVLNGMKEIFEKQAIDEDKVDEIYKTYNYDISSNIVKPIKELISDSIIKNYDNLSQSDIKLYQLDSHGAIKRNIKKLQNNCVVVLITPLNRYTYGESEHLNTIDGIISQISSTLNDSNNNIYDIIKMIKSYNCFDKSTIIYPNQYYFNYMITTGNTCKGSRCYNPKTKSFNNIKKVFDTTLDEYIEEERIKLKSNPQTISVFFVKGCRSCNSESYDNFTIEKMYIYENFINLLNSSIFEFLSSNLSINDLKLNNDCIKMIESKDKSVIRNRTNDNESKQLILNSSLGKKIKDEDLYKLYLYKQLYNKKKLIPSIINNLFSKNKINTKFSKIIDTDVIINFIKKIKEIIDKEEDKWTKQTSIINFYILLYYIIITYINKDDYKKILYIHKDELNAINEECKIETKFNIDVALFIDLIQYQYNNTYDIKIFIDHLYILINLLNTLNSVNKYRLENLLKKFIQHIFIKNFNKLINNLNKYKDSSLFKKLDVIINIFDDKELTMLQSKLESKRLFNNELYEIVMLKIFNNSTVRIYDMYKYFTNTEKINIKSDFIINFIYNRLKTETTSQIFIYFIITNNNFLKTINTINDSSLLQKLDEILNIFNIEQLKNIKNEMYNEGLINNSLYTMILSKITILNGTNNPSLTTNNPSSTTNNPSSTTNNPSSTTNNSSSTTNNPSSPNNLLNSMKTMLKNVEQYKDSIYNLFIDESTYENNDYVEILKLLLDKLIKNQILDIDISKTKKIITGHKFDYSDIDSLYYTIIYNFIKHLDFSKNENIMFIYDLYVTLNFSGDEFDFLKDINDSSSIYINKLNNNLQLNILLASSINTGNDGDKNRTTKIKLIGDLIELHDKKKSELSQSGGKLKKKKTQKKKKMKTQNKKKKTQNKKKKQ